MSKRGYLFPVFYILFLSLTLFLKNFSLSVRIKDGIGTMGIDYLGFAFILISLLFITRSLTITISIFFLINIFDSFLLFSNRIYYRYFKDYITIDVFSLSRNIPFTWKNILNLINSKDLLVFLDLPFLVFFSIIFIRKLKFSLKKRRLSFALLLFLAGIFITGLNLYLLHRALPHVLTFRYGSAMIFNSTSVHNFYILNLFEEGIKKEKIDFNLPDLPRRLIFNDNDLEKDFKFERKLWNIIIVQFESLGAEVIGKEIDGKEITPTLNELSKVGLYFKNFYSQAMTCSGTLDVELASLSSYYPSSKSPYAIKYTNKIPFTLPRFLKNFGYRTMFFHGNKGDFYRRSTVMRIFGFERLYFADYFYSRESKYKGTDDYPFFLECAEVIKKSSQPFFAYLVTLSSHAPFEFPEKEKPSLEIKDPSVDETTRKYYQVLNYSDSAFRAFFDELRRSSVTENTIFVLFGDHPRKISEESERRENEVIRDVLENKVPFIITIPGAKNAIFDEPASHVDISPTILSILGLKYDGVLLGRNLLSKKVNGFVLINRNPVILIRRDNVFWGYIQKGFTNCMNKCSQQELSKLDEYLKILQYSEFILRR